MRKIETTAAPAAIGPYSQGYCVNGFVFTSGQIPVDPATGAIPEGIAAQAEQSCKNVQAILEAAGTTTDKVIKTTCFLADMGDFTAFNEVYIKLPLSSVSIIFGVVLLVCGFILSYGLSSLKSKKENVTKGV